MYLRKNTIKIKTTHIKQDYWCSMISMNSVAVFWNPLGIHFLQQRGRGECFCVLKCPIKPHEYEADSGRPPKPLTS